MSDPLSILGAAAGVTSLIIQITDDCIKAYKYYIEAVGMKDEHDYMQLKLQIERQRFLTWALEAGILYSPSRISPNLQVHKSLLLSVLAEVKSLLEGHAKKHGSFADVQEIEKHTLEDIGAQLIDILHMKSTPKVTHAPQKSRKPIDTIIQAGRNLRTIIAEPRRLVWAAIDKGVFESFLRKLNELNSFLITLLDGTQAKRLQEAMNASYLEILQIRNDIKSLIGLVEALAPETISSSISTGLHIREPTGSHSLGEVPKTDKTDREYLTKLAKIKMKHKEMEILSMPSKLCMEDIHFPATAIQLNDVEFADSIDWYQPHRFNFRTEAKYQDQDVWIEWKKTPMAIQVSRQIHIEQTELRLRLLTDLLSSEKPARFCAPPCLGYVRQSGPDAQCLECDFGIMFQKPKVAPSESYMRSLRDILTGSKPSLSARMGLSAVLARCIQSFHAVGWYHKGLRSDNVIFFIEEQPSFLPASHKEAQVPYDDYKSVRSALGAPYLTGFDLSRPSAMISLTENPEFDPEQEIYRHPSAQSFLKDQKLGYRQSYDLYSLGIIFLEIAFWQPIERLIGHDDCARLSRPMLQNVKSILLGEHATPPPVVELEQSQRSITPTSESRGLLNRVAIEFGESFHDVVETCLRADELELSGIDSEENVSMWLQRVMEFDIAQVIENITAALRTR